MKRTGGIIGVALLLLIVFCISGCSGSDPASTESPQSEMKSVDEYDADIDELTEYDFKRFFGKYEVRRGVTSDMKSWVCLLNGFNDEFPIERIKKIDSDHIVVVYKLKNEEGSTALTYILFGKMFYDGDEPGKEYDWVRTGEFYHVIKKLSSADFENVMIGDSAKSVNEIDPAVAFDCEGSTFDKVETIRVLTDGIMLIEFEKPEIPTSVDVSFSEYKVSSKSFYPYSDSNFPDSIPTIHISYGSGITHEYDWKLVTLCDFSFIEYLE